MDCVRSIEARRGFTLLELIVVISIIAVLAGIILPAVQQTREAAARARCGNNIKQVGIALHNYAGTQGGFPPARVTTPRNHGWVQAILPFLEQQNISEIYRRDVNWNHATNAAATQSDLRTLRCPSAPLGRTGAGGRAVNDYPALNHVASNNPLIIPPPPADPMRNGAMASTLQRPILDITDGTSNTIIVAEDAGRNQLWRMGQLVIPGNAGGAAWASPASEVTLHGSTPDGLHVAPNGTGPWPCAINCTNDSEIYSFHRGGAQVALADGSVRFLRSRIELPILAALITRAGGENVSIPD